MSADAFRLAADLTEMSRRAQIGGAMRVRYWGQILQTTVKARASGRPGPRAQTGDYRRSIDLEFGHDGMEVYAEVGTNKPQGRRLEHGFVGPDSLGRVFAQQPLPHFGPAFDEIEPRFTEDMESLGDLPGGSR